MTDQENIALALQMLRDARLSGCSSETVSITINRQFVGNWFVSYDRLSREYVLSSIRY